MYNLRQALTTANKQYYVSNDRYIIHYEHGGYEVYDKHINKVYDVYEDEASIFQIIGKEVIKRNWVVRDESTAK
jgi:hypothetical protein